MYVATYVRRFEQNLKVAIQDLGWRFGWRYLPQMSDIESTAFWYQAEPHAAFPVRRAMMSAK